MTLEHVMLSPDQLVPNLRQLQAEVIGSSTYVHVNITHTHTHTHVTKSLTRPEEAMRHDKLCVLTHAHFSHDRRGS